MMFQDAVKKAAEVYVRVYGKHDGFTAKLTKREALYLYEQAGGDAEFHEQFSYRFSGDVFFLNPAD